MKNIITIAKNTFKETIRDRILYAILAFSILFLLSTLMLGSISLGEDIKVIKDLGLAGIYIFSLLITIFLGTSLIHKEIEKKTLYIILSKPVLSTHFILGKFLGLLASIKLNIFIVTSVYLVIVYLKGGGIDFLSLWSTLLLIFEISIFIGLTILFSTITTPLAGAIYSVIILYIGHSLSILKDYAEKSSEIIHSIVNITYYLLPNLEKFNIRNSIVYGVVPAPLEIICPIVYSVLYTIILLWLAILALKNQDF